MAHLFICPNCGNRSTADASARPAFAAAPKGCHEVRLRVPVRAARRLLPGARRRVLRLDQEGAVIGCGRGSFELTGLKEERVIGRPANEVLGLRLRGRRPTTSRPRWSGACACCASRSQVNAEGDLPAQATADLFPAYDDDGGLLIVLTPQK